MGNLSVAMFDYRRARPNTDKYIRLSENRYPKSTVSSALSVWRYTLHFQTNPSIVLLVNIPAVGTPSWIQVKSPFPDTPLLVYCCDISHKSSIKVRVIPHFDGETPNNSLMFPTNDIFKAKVWIYRVYIPTYWDYHRASIAVIEIYINRNC